MMNEVSTDGPAHQLCQELREAGLSTIEILRRLRQDFGLSLPDAKAIMIRADTGQSLEQYQETLIEPLQQALRDLEDSS